MKDTPQNFIKVHAVIGIVAAFCAIGAMVSGYFFCTVIAFGIGWLSLYNIGNLKDQIRAGKAE